MSKFFDPNSSSESESESDNEIVEVQKTTKPKFNYESDEEQKGSRVVLSEREKRIEEINNLVRQLKNAKKIKDIVKSNQIFDEIVKAYEKSRKVIEKEGHFKHYIRAIADLETYVIELWESSFKSTASKSNSTALTKLRQRIRKYNKDFEKEISDYRANPDNYPEEEKISKTDSEESDSEEEVKTKKETKTKVEKSEESESDENDEESDISWDETEESSSDEDLVYDKADAYKLFLKDTTTTKTKKDEKKKPKEKKAAVTVDTDRESEKPKFERKLFTKEDEITPIGVFNKLNEIVAARGRKGTDRHDQLEMLKELREISRSHNFGHAIDFKIVFNQMAISFDYNTRISACMKSEVFQECLGMLNEMINIVLENPDIEVNENISEEEENVHDKTKPYRIRGCVLTVTDRMHEEFTKILQQCDAHGTEYVERLKDEPKLNALTDKLQTYLEIRGNTQELCRVYLRKVENVYYKYDKNNDKNSSELVGRLCKYIYTNDSTDRLRAKAMLCHIYHNALHDRWFEARDLLLMSHLQESIDNSDIPLQILYNRTMVQVGLCAFRVGNIKDAHSALLDIQVGNRAKELLAQGVMVQRNVEKSKEQETKERQRLIPFHMHINLELIECVYLVSAMLIEIPFMSSREFETKKRLISKQFHYQLKLSERQPVVGPPENMREHVVAASRVMKKGDWKACIDYLINDKMNAKVWDLMAQSDKVKQMLKEKVKEESLRTYLFKFSAVYESISIESLAKMFDLPRNFVYSVISKMIINEELMASLDEPTQTIVMHRTEPTKLQTLALQLSEKITNLMDQTERMVQIRGGEMGAFLNRNQQGQQNQQAQQNKQQNYKQTRGQRSQQQK